MDPLNAIPDKWRDRFSVTDGCWLWQGALQRYGAVVRHRGGTHLAHRVIWEFVHGPPPPRLRPTCEEPSCVNPAHWTEEDEYLEGRWQHTRSQREEVLKRVANGEPKAVVARELGVAERTVHRWVRRAGQATRKCND